MEKEQVIMNKCLLCEELYNENDLKLNGYCCKVCKEIDEVDLNE